MTTLTLYTRPGCHLCDEARELLSLLGLGEACVEADITTRADWLQTYGARIPVLAGAGGRELSWPFGPAEVRGLLDPVAE